MILSVAIVGLASVHRLRLPCAPSVDLSGRWRLLAWAWLIGLVLAGVMAAPAAAAPTTRVIANSALFFGGEPAVIGFEVINPPDGIQAELYFGFIHPDGTSIFTISPSIALLGPVGPVSEAVPTRLAPPGFSETAASLIRLTVPTLPVSDIPAGTYLYYALLVRAGSLADNSLDQVDILALDLKPIVYTPILRSPNPTDPFLLSAGSGGGATIELFGVKDATGPPNGLTELRWTDAKGAITIYFFDAQGRLVRVLGQTGFMDFAWDSPTQAQAHLMSLDKGESVQVPVTVPPPGSSSTPAGGARTAVTFAFGEPATTVTLTRDTATCGAPVPVDDAQLVLVLYEHGGRSRWYVADAATGNLYPTRLPLVSGIGASVGETCHNVLALSSTACASATAAAAAACAAAGSLASLPALQHFCSLLTRNDPTLCQDLGTALNPGEGGTSACDRASQIDDVANRAATAGGPITLTPVAVVDGVLTMGPPAGGLDPNGPLPALALNVATSRPCPDVPPGPDTTAPDTQITGGPSGTIAPGSVTFTWTGTDDVTATDQLVYSYQLVGFEANPSAFGPATSVTYPNLPEGSYTFNVVARDAAGNVDQSPASRSFAVSPAPPGPDMTPPDTQITGGPTGTITSGAASFSWTGSDNVTPTNQLVYSFQLVGVDANPSAFGPATSANYSNLPNGSYTFSVVARDTANNADPSAATRAFTVNVAAADTTPPDTSITEGPPEAVTTPAATFSWTGSDNATPTNQLVYSFQLVGFDASPSAFGAATSANYPNLPGGNYTFNVTARDAAGNADASAATRSFSVSLTYSGGFSLQVDLAPDNCQRITIPAGGARMVFSFPASAAPSAQVIIDTLTLTVVPPGNTMCPDSFDNLTTNPANDPTAPLVVSGNSISFDVTTPPGPTGSTTRVVFSGTRGASAVTGTATVTISVPGSDLAPPRSATATVQINSTLQ